MKRMLAPVSLALFLAMPGVAAWADDRPPTDAERTAIEEVLRAEGFTSWEEIEWDDDGYWEVDDAVDANGKEWDLKLNAELAITERDD